MRHNAAPLLLAAFVSLPSTRSATGFSAPLLREDALTTLFPVDAKALAAATTSEEAAGVVARTLPSLGDVMSPEFHGRILALATEGSAEAASPDRNPIGGKVGEQTRSIPFSRWFLVGMRLSPCANPTLLPTSWLRSGGRQTEARVCVPQLRLVAQAFGARREEDAVSGVFRPSGSSDDKTIHIVLDLLPGIDDTAAARLRRAETALEESVLEASARGQLTLSGLEKVMNATGTHELQLALQDARVSLAREALSLQNARPSGGTGDLGTGLGAGGSLEEAVRAVVTNPTGVARTQATLRESLRGERGTLLRGARLRHITLNFSDSGTSARPGSAWTMVKIEAASMASATLLKESRADRLAVLTKVPVVSFAWEQALSGTLDVRRADAGLHEALLPVPGRPASVDEELLAAARSDPTLMRALSHGGLFPFLDDALEGEFVSASRGAASQTLGVVTLGLSTPALHSTGSASCSGCHAASGARERYLGAAGFAGAPAEASLLRDNTTRVNFGHDRFNEMWNLRMLGYFERAVSVGDRVVLETRSDLADARALLAGGTLP